MKSELKTVFFIWVNHLEEERQSNYWVHSNFRLISGYLIDIPLLINSNEVVVIVGRCHLVNHVFLVISYPSFWSSILPLTLLCLSIAWSLFLYELLIFLHFLCLIYVNIRINWVFTNCFVLFLSFFLLWPP